MSTEEEKQKLEKISQNSLYSAGVSAKMVEYSFEVFSRFIRGDSILEMGPAEGLMTELLAGMGKELVVVEGSASFCRDLAGRFPQCEIVNSLFEEYAPGRKFDNIILGHVLEHVAEPAGVLRNTASWLAPGGRIIASVPNSRSVHRQAAVMMGLLPFEESLNEMDLRHGHRRVFNPETFRRAFVEAGLTVDVFGGYWLKPVSNAQIERGWSEEMLRAFMRLGERYPDIAAEIYIIAKP